VISNNDSALATAVLPTCGHYSLDQTLACGQAFRWKRTDGAWESVVGGRWVRLRQGDNCILAAAIAPAADWGWLEYYLQVQVDYEAMLATFPRDDIMGAAIQACHGMRLLRQEPWECLASFILSSCKQVVHIQQMVDTLSRRFGDPVASFFPGEREAEGRGKAHSRQGEGGEVSEERPWFTFPSADRLAQCAEKELRDCKLGFRAPYLLETAKAVARRQIDLAALERMDYEQALEELTRLPGVGEKIANCALLFACGFHQAFPVDVWIRRVMREWYLKPRRLPLKKLESFAAAYFGPTAGYAQQYLFHYRRVHV
jgi:N-glycosylase/DNA lyase